MFANFTRRLQLRASLTHTARLAAVTAPNVVVPHMAGLLTELPNGYRYNPMHRSELQMSPSNANLAELEPIIIQYDRQASLGQEAYHPRLLDCENEGTDPNRLNLCYRPSIFSGEGSLSRCEISYS